MTSATAAREAAPAGEKSRDETRFFLWAGGVAVLTAILFFVRLGARALWSSEFRWAEIAREMLLTHHYFWPTINGHVYYDKPLGSYWLVGMACELPKGQRGARDASPPQLFLADDQRPRLLRQAARFVLAGRDGGPAH